MTESDVSSDSFGDIHIIATALEQGEVVASLKQALNNDTTDE